jgi:hypothetical protein
LLAPFGGFLIMKAISILGIVFVIVGIITLVFGGFPVSSDTHQIDVGPFEATVKEEKHYPVPTILSIAALAAGVTLIVLGSRK